MRRQTSEWSVRMLADLKGRINVDAEYQRGVVWSKPQQMLLIDSLLRGFDLPKIFLRKLPDGSTDLFDVIDGVQRLTSIWSFLSDMFPLPRSYPPYPRIGPVGGKCWSELPQDAQDRLQFAQVTVTQLETDDEDEIRELFKRLQEGEPLKAAEKRNAMDVPVRDFVANTLAAHPLWPETGLPSRRFGWHEMSAVTLALVKNGGATGLKGADLMSLYENTDFDPEGDIANQVVTVLDRLYDIAAHKRGTIRTRWGVVDLLLTLNRLDEEEVSITPSKVMDFFMGFEIERREAAAALSDLRSTVLELAASEADIDEQQVELPDIALDMLTYVNAFTREGAAKDNVAARAEVMAARLRRYLRD